MCGQLNLFKDNYRLYCLIDSFLQLLMAAREMVKQMQLWEPCVKNQKPLNGREAICHFASKLGEFLHAFKHYFSVLKRKEKIQVSNTVKVLKVPFANVLIYHPVISILITIPTMIYFVITMVFSSSKHRADTQAINDLEGSGMGRTLSQRTHSYHVSGGSTQQECSQPTI